MTTKRISVEEHFSTPEHLDCLRAILEGTYPSPEVLAEEEFILSDAPFLLFLNEPVGRQIATGLCDIGKGRLQDMDETGIDMQVLSLISPGVQVLDRNAGTELAKKLNDTLSAAVQEQPARLAGLACLAPQDPNDAADELERVVRDLGLKGACINSHTKGEYLDDSKYWVILERAEQLDVPIYLHPRAPSPGMIKPYLGYPLLDSPMLGFGAETALHATRLICSGVFDRYPGLRIILGHMGEGLPLWTWRMDDMLKRTPLAQKLRKTPSEYLKENFVVTMSGMYSEHVLSYTLSVLGADNILFAADYPLGSNQEAVGFMDGAPISNSDKEKIYHLNAERVFSL